MTMIKERLTAAMEAKNNDLNSFVWKFARDGKGEQKEIRLVDATEEQLNSFYQHCASMLYSKDKSNPGRYTVLDLIKEQREKCDTEILLRKLDAGTLFSSTGGTKYPRYVYLQDIRDCLNKNREQFPTSELKNIPISVISNGLPEEFQRISINTVLDGCMDNLGVMSKKHITFTFLINLGIYLTPEELKELTEKDENGKVRSKLEVIKERLKIAPNVRLTVKPTGLTYSELRSMINLRSDKYSKLTTDQLNTLRKRILFFLEQEIDFHIQMWEKKMKEIEAVANEKGYTPVDYTHIRAHQTSLHRV